MADKVEPLTERELIIAGGGDPDAAPVAEEKEAAEPEKSEVETKAEEKKAVDDKEVAKGTDAQPASSWIDDTVKAKAKDYDLDEEDLKDFGTAEEFARATKILDKQKAKAVKPAEKKVELAKAEADPEEQDEDIDPAKYAEYDEDVVKLAKVAKKSREQVKAQAAEQAELKKAVQELMTRQQRADQQRVLVDFHDILESQDEDLFGRAVNKAGEPVELDAAKEDNRRKVYEQFVKLHNEEIAEAQKAGREPKLPPMRKLIEKATEMALAKELVARERKRVQDEIAAQSKKRRPVSGSTTRNNPVPAKKPQANDTASLVSEIANDPQIAKFWEKAQEENGK